MLTRSIWLCLVVTAIALSGCGSGARGEGPGQQGNGGVEGPPINWDDPLHGPKFDSAAAVDQAVGFNVVIPKWGPKPDLIEAEPMDSSQVPPAQEVVALVYHLPAEGTILILEQGQGPQTIEHLTELAQEHNPVASGEPDPMQMVPLRGTQGLLIQGNGIGRIIWLENGLQIDITGQTVTPDQVLSLAAQF